MSDSRNPWERQSAIDRLEWPPESAGSPESKPTEASPTGPVSRWPGLGMIAAVSVFAALVGGFAGGAAVAFLTEESPAGDPRTLPSGALPAGVTRVDVTSAVSEVAELGRTSVVRIESERRSDGRRTTDVGSGVVIDDSGHIVTNAHVVLGTSALRVFLADGTERQAFLIGHDSPFTDVAVLQIGLDGPPPLSIGDSSALQPGETVIAVGNPLSEFAGSVTVGVVSGVNRIRLFDGVRNDDLIQTDAALNNGNSGGALLNLAGQFVGMPTAVLRESNSGQPVEGIGFAIPSNRLLAVAESIIKNGGSLPRPSLGMEHADLTAEVAVRAGLLPGTTGALVTAVVQGGPAGAAGIRPGDVVTRIGEYEIGDDRPLLNALMEYAPEQSVTVYLARNGQSIETQVRLGRRS
ncbi:MAG: S1C family serine protease [Dehalococcoidia bacterium]